MRPTNRFRWKRLTEKEVRNGYPNAIGYRVLQQWWQDTETVLSDVIGEWRDVPVEDE